MINPPDQSLQAIIAINSMLALDHESQHRTLARLIAATVHSGPGSALYEFASRDELFAEDVLRELNEVVVPREREGWVDALGRYVLLAPKDQL